ncbi:MAG: glycosyltransferase family 2 protein [Vicinamibacterales bacterium]
MPSPITVVIATVHRPKDMARAAESVLQGAYARLHVIVVNQGDDEILSEHLRPFSGDTRLSRTTLHGGGLSAALNLGISLSTSPIVAITGDDCVPRADWLANIDRAFSEDPQLGILFGHVASAPFDPDQGFVPGCTIEQEFVATSMRDLHRMSGTTACMALRKTVWQECNGFDEALGLGAPFGSAEDLDLALRALEAGYRVRQTPTVQVEHQTPVLWRDRRTVVRRNWYGSGAAMAKSAKLAPIMMLIALARLARRWLSGGSGVAATYGITPDRGGMLAGFATGFVAGLVRRVDRRRRLFVR